MYKYQEVGFLKFILLFLCIYFCQEFDIWLLRIHGWCKASCMARGPQRSLVWNTNWAHARSEHLNEVNRDAVLIRRGSAPPAVVYAALPGSFISDASVLTDTGQMVPVGPSPADATSCCHLRCPRLLGETEVQIPRLFAGLAPCAHPGHPSQGSATVRKQIHTGVLQEASEIGFSRQPSELGEAARALRLKTGGWERKN